MPAVSRERVAAIFMIFFCFYGFVLATLFIRQSVYKEFYQKKGRFQYRDVKQSVPVRGRIFDRQGFLLAGNSCAESLYIMPHKIKNKEKVLNFIKEQFPSCYNRVCLAKSKEFVFVKRHISPQEKKAVIGAALTDLRIIDEPCRLYSQSFCSSVVGRTDYDNNGISGIELFFNAQLGGRPGTIEGARDARCGSFYFNRKLITPEVPGKDITLSLDSSLQFLVWRELSESLHEFDAREGAAIVVNPVTGEIVASVSIPDLDPHLPYNDALYLMKHRALTDCYERGSVMKICVALAALEEECVALQELIDCKGSTQATINGRSIKTPFAHNILPFQDMVAVSNNIGIAIVAQRLGTKLYDHYKRMGFGSLTRLQLPAETAGFVNPPELWSEQSVFSLSYGYEISTTLMQLAQFFCLIARDGYPVSLTFLKQSAAKNGLCEQKKRLYMEKSIEGIRSILCATVARGTARLCAIPGYTVMAKTGTANELVDGCYDSTKNNFTCAGIIEKGAYKRVIVVFVRNTQRQNLFASSVVAPLFRRIAQKTALHDQRA